MKNFKIIFVFTFLIQGISSYAQDAFDILNKSDQVMYAPEDQKATVKLIMTDKKGNQQVREAEYIQKGSKMRLFRFIAPASQNGIAFLSLPDDVMYLYMPAYGKEQRIASHIKNQSFAGTDFTYDDMESKTFTEEYTPTLLSENDDSWDLELVPKLMDKSDYSKLVVTIGKDNYYFRKVEYYDKGGRHVKELLNKKVEQVNGYWVAREMLMTDLLKNHSSQMIFEELVLNSGIPDDEFTVRKLRQ